MKKTGMSKLLALILCAMLFAAMASVSTGVCETVTETPAEVEVITLGAEIGFQVIDLEGNTLLFDIHTDEATVGAALLAYELIEGEMSEYGLYVKTVCGVTADYNVDGHYWAFYIGEEYASTGVDSTPVEDGTIYTFKVE